MAVTLTGAAGRPTALTVAAASSAVPRFWLMMTPCPYLLGRPVCLSVAIILNRQVCLMQAAAAGDAAAASAIVAVEGDPQRLRADKGEISGAQRGSLRMHHVRGPLSG